MLCSWDQPLISATASLQFIHSTHWFPRLQFVHRSPLPVLKVWKYQTFTDFSAPFVSLQFVHRTRFLFWPNPIRSTSVHHHPANRTFNKRRVIAAESSTSSDMLGSMNTASWQPKTTTLPKLATNQWNYCKIVTNFQVDSDLSMHIHWAGHSLAHTLSVQCIIAD